jgi:hypothetical protein
VGTPTKKPPTTVACDPADRPSDLLERDFGAAAPNARWVAANYTSAMFATTLKDLSIRQSVGRTGISLLTG